MKYIDSDYLSAISCCVIRQKFRVDCRQPADNSVVAGVFEELLHMFIKFSEKYSTLAPLEAYIFAHREACTSDPGEKGG